jgi:hemoglobin-like flavoprotein
MQLTSRFCLRFASNSFVSVEHSDACKSIRLPLGDSNRDWMPAPLCCRRRCEGDGNSIMTPEQADLIRKSFDTMWTMHRSIAVLCYGRFFKLAPEARSLFPRDMERQQLKLMNMIAALVGALDQRELFQSLITNSGRQHAGFGVQPSQYVALGEALIWSLEQQFGASFTPELREAWEELYATVQDAMLRAGAQH